MIPRDRRGNIRRRPYYKPEIHAALEDRVLLAITPVVSLDQPSAALLNESFDLAVSFDNAGIPGDVGYGPYVQLILPPAGSQTQQVEFVSASIQGAGMSAREVTFDANGNALHPLLKNANGQSLTVTGPPGGTLVVLPLPFGSYAPEQPPAEVQIVARMLGETTGVLGTEIPVQAGGGFYLGANPLDDPRHDPPIIAAPMTEEVEPTVLLVSKQYLSPEGETATGPNFERAWRIIADIADGQTIDHLVLSDELSTALQFVAADDVLIHGVPADPAEIEASIDPSTLLPGGQLIRQLRSVIGTNSNADVSIDVRFYVPELIGASGGTPVLDPATGMPTGPSVSPISNTAVTYGTWKPQAGGSVVLETVQATATVQPKAIAIQKYVLTLVQQRPGVNGPGDVLEYTIDFQVSDFFDLQDFLLSDVLSDGQSLLPGYTPTLSISGRPSYGPAPFTGTNFQSSVQPDGSIAIRFDVSQQLVDSGKPGQLTGGRVRGAYPPTTGRVTFRSVIDESFRHDGEPVTEGDQLSNDVAGSVAIVGQPGTPGDGSSAGLIVNVSSVSKSIYAVNGHLVTSPKPEVTADDVVTVRLTQRFPLTSFQSLTLTDFLPLPVFRVTDIVPASFCQTRVDAAAPPVNTAWYGPSNTFNTPGTGDLFTPAISIDGASNSVSFSYGLQSQNRATTLDLLFSLRATDLPFADQLLLSNQVSFQQVSTQGRVTTQDQIAQLTLTEPFLKLTKGAVSSRSPQADVTPPQARFTPATVGPVPFARPGNPGAAFTGTINSANLATEPVASDVRGLQAGDLVKFALVVENAGTGRNGAFNVVIRDTIPSGLIVPSTAAGLNLRVTRGDGTPLAYTDLGGGLFGSGIQLVDDTAQNQGALAASDPISGENLAVVTFDLEIAQTVTANQALDNTGLVPRYTSTESGPNFLTSPLQDKARATTLAASMVKSISATSQSFTTGSNLAIGEIGTYTVVVSIPQGTLVNARVTDTLPVGLALVDVEEISANSTSLTTSRGSFVVVRDTAVVANLGRLVTYDFATLTNSDRDDTTTEQIRIVYRAVALDVAANVNNAKQTNTARLTYTGGSSQAQTTATILVPQLQVRKSIDRPLAQAKETVTYTIVIDHTSASGTDAFDLSLWDAVPAGVTYVPGSWVHVTGVAPSALSDAGGLLLATIPELRRGQSTTLRFQAIVNDDVESFQTVTNTAQLGYTTLPGDVPGPISPYNPASTERVLSTTGSVTFSPLATIQKTITATSVPETPGYDLTIGEVATYQVRVAVPRGVSSNARLLDTMPAGLALVALDSLTADPGLTTDLAGGFPAALAGASVNPGGIGYTIGLGNIMNAASAGDPQGYLTLTFRAVVLNIPGNQTDTTLVNSSRFTTAGGGVTAIAPPLRVVTPRIDVEKSVSPAATDRLVPVTFTLVVTSAGTAPLFDVQIADLLPSGLTYVTGSFRNAAGVPPTSIDPVNLTAAIDLLMPGLSSTYTLQAAPTASAAPGSIFTNVAQATGSSLPGNPGPISPYNPDSTERSSTDVDTADVTVNSNSLAGTVYLDYDNDGTQDPGEPGIPGVSVTLAGTPTAGTMTDVTLFTDGNGRYTFNAIPAGQYTVTEDRGSIPTLFKGTDRVGSQGTITQAAGTLILPVSTHPASSAIAGIVLHTGTSVNGVLNDFGELPAGSLAGTVYEDATGTGHFDPLNDPPIPGVAIDVIGIDYLGNDVQRTTTTGIDGTYVFPGLALGRYRLVETQPVGFAQGTNTVGTLGGTTLQAPIDQIKEIVVGAGNLVQPTPSARYDGTGYDFGELLRVDNIIVKDASTVVPPVGSSFTYSLRVSNNGPSLSVGTYVTDTIDDKLEIDPAFRANPPAGVTVTGGTDIGGGVIVGGLVTWTIGDLPAAESRELDFNVRVVQFATGPIVNRAVVHSTTTDSNPDNNISTAVVTPTSLLSGLYFLDYDANGVFDAYDHAISGMRIDATSGGGGSNQATTDTTGFYLFPSVEHGAWTLTGEMPTADSHFFQSLAGVLIDGNGTITPSGQAVANTITGITIPETPVQVGHFYNFSAVPLGRIAGSVLESRDDATPGSVPIAGVTLTLVGTTYDGRPVTTTTSTDALGRYAFTDLVPGSYQVLQSQPAGYLQGLIEVGTQGGVALNPTDAIDAIVIGPPSLAFGQPPPNKPPFDPSMPSFVYESEGNNFNEFRLVDLAIVKSVSRPHPEIGESVTYTITVSNIGPGVATGVAAIDFLPAGMTITSANPDLGTFDPDTGIWSIGSLKGTVDFPGINAPTTASLVITSTVPPPTLPLSAPYILTNTALVSGNERETTYVNNASEAAINPLLADVVVSKSVDNSTPSRGEVVTFDVGIWNVGPNTTDGVYLEDLVPPGLTYVPGSALVSTGDFDENTGIWIVGVIPVGPIYSLQFQAVVATYDPVVNVATAFGSRIPETDYENNSASAGVDPLQPALTIAKSVIQNGTPLAGQDVTYEIQVANVGLGDATPVDITEYVPTDLTYVSHTILGLDGTPVVPPDGGTFNPSTGVWNVGMIRASGGYILRLVCRMQISPHIQVVNTAEILDPTPTTLEPSTESQVDPLGIIRGRLFWDVNMDRTDSPGDPGIPNVPVTLRGFDTQGRPYTAVVTTDLAGNYAFIGVPQGPWNVSVVSSPAGYLREVVLPGTQGGTASTDSIASMPLSGSLVSNFNDFGFIRASTLSGYVVWDVNHDLIRNSADLGILDVTMTLTGSDYLGQRVGLATTTDATGFYSFTNLAPGTYEVVEGPARPFVHYGESPGTAGGQASTIGQRPGFLGRTRPGETPRSIYDIAIQQAVDAREYDFFEIQKPGCRLRCAAVRLGASVDELVRRRQADSTRFDQNHPSLGASLAAGRVPSSLIRGRHLQVLAARTPAVGTRTYQLVRTPGTRRPTLIAKPIVFNPG